MCTSQKNSCPLQIITYARPRESVPSGKVYDSCYRIGFWVLDLVGFWWVHTVPYEFHGAVQMRRRIRSCILRHHRTNRNSIFRDKCIPDDVTLQ